MAVGTTLKISFDGAAVQRGLASLNAGFTNIAKIGVTAFKSIGVGAIAGVAGITALAVKINSIGEAAISSDNRVKSIVKQMGLFGTEADEVSKRLLDFADVSARQLGIDDDIIAMTQAKLSTFKELASSADEAGGAFDRATMAAIDMAAAGFGTAETNAVQLGKALNDPIKGINSLTRSGITFTAEEKKMIAGMVEMGRAAQAQNIILKAVEQQVGGTAAATATASSKMQVSFSQLVEAFAKPFSTGFSSLPGHLESVFSGLVAQAERFGAIFANSISDAMAGNFDRFITMGGIIADAVITGYKASFTSQLLDLGQFMNQRKNWITGEVNPEDAAQGEKDKNQVMSGMRDDFFARMREAFKNLEGTGSNNQGLVPGSGGRFQFAPPGSNSPLSDANGNKVVEVLSKIEKNTAQGATM